MDGTIVMFDDLARRIDAEYEAAMQSARTAIEHAIACGRLLLEAKAKVAHGEWLPWLKANTKVSERTARIWMKFARHEQLLIEKSVIIADLTFAEADRLLKGHLGRPDGVASAESIQAASTSHAAAPPIREMPQAIATSLTDVPVDPPEVVLGVADDDAAQRLAGQKEELGGPAAREGERPIPSDERSILPGVGSGIRAVAEIRAAEPLGERTFRELRSHLVGGGPRPAVPSQADTEAMTGTQRGIIRRLAEVERAWTVALLDRLNREATVNLGADKFAEATRT